MSREAKRRICDGAGGERAQSSGNRGKEERRAWGNEVQLGDLRYLSGEKNGMTVGGGIAKTKVSAWKPQKATWGPFSSGEE